MPTLKLEFCVELTRNLSRKIPETGPVFHRWLPDGRRDAIELTAPDEEERISIWFERRTVIDHGFLRWKQDGMTFDPSIMTRQYKLDAGPLFGEMNARVSKSELTAIENFLIKLGDKFGDRGPDSDEYVEAGKRITSKIQERVGSLVSRLRTQYGQYWLEDVLSWDSRSMSLGSYCSGLLRLRWWSASDSTWYRFLPTASMAVVSSPEMPGRGYGEYLTEADWRALQNGRYQPDVDLGIKMLGAATEALDTGNWSYAFITVITALEIALAGRVKARQEHKRVQQALNSFEDTETLPARAAVVLLTCGIASDAVESVLSAIQTRNSIAHEGYRPNEKQAAGLWPIMQTIRSLMQINELKTPIITNTNGLSAAS